MVMHCFVVAIIFGVTNCNAYALRTPYRILYTAALIDHFYSLRQQEYIYSLRVLAGLHIAPYIVESCKEASFFDLYGLPICYSRTNNAQLKNKGVNEAVSLKYAFSYFGFDDNDIIVKLTGRYFFKSGSFFKSINALPTIDAFVKISNDCTQCFTGCFALRAKFFVKFLEELDLEKMEENMICIETELREFLMRNPDIRVCYVDSLDVTGKIFGTGECVLFNL